MHWQKTKTPKNNKYREPFTYAADHFDLTSKEAIILYTHTHIFCIQS